MKPTGPASAVRFVCERAWGDNKFVVLEVVNDQFVVKAAQTSKRGALRHCLPGYLLVDIRNTCVLSWFGSTSIDCASLFKIESAIEQIKALAGDNYRIVRLALLALEEIPEY